MDQPKDDTKAGKPAKRRYVRKQPAKDVKLPLEQPNLDPITIDNSSKSSPTGPCLITVTSTLKVEPVQLAQTPEVPITNTTKAKSGGIATSNKSATRKKVKTNTKEPVNDEKLEGKPDQEPPSKRIKVESTPLEVSEPAEQPKQPNPPQPPDCLPSDPVIEQWYMDPYNRYDPEGPAGIHLRKIVLETALRNRGFRGNRIQNIVNWIVRCNGRHREYDELVGSNCRNTETSVQGRYSRCKRKLGTPKSGQSKVKVDTSLITPTKAGKDNDTSHLAGHHLVIEAPTDLSPTSTIKHSNDEKECIIYLTSDDGTTSPIGIGLMNGDYESEDVVDKDHNLEFSAEEQAALQQLNDQITSLHNTFHSKHAPGTQAYRDAYDDWLIVKLKRTQEFWSMIYGDDLDSKPVAADQAAVARENKKQNAEPEVSFTYFRDAQGVPKVDLQYRTQGLKPLKRVMYKDREVWTEDEHFGLTPAD